MRAKEYLKRLQWMDTVINQKNRELEDLRKSVTSVGSVDYSKERVQTSYSGEAPFEKMIERIADLEAKINAEIDAFVDEKHKIINQIQTLKNSKYVEILYKRYVEFLTFERIAADMNYSVRNIHFIHKKALQNFEQSCLQK